MLNVKLHLSRVLRPRVQGSTLRISAFYNIFISLLFFIIKIIHYIYAPARNAIYFYRFIIKQIKMPQIYHLTFIIWYHPHPHQDVKC